MSKGLIFGLESKQEPLKKWTKRSKLALSNLLDQIFSADFFSKISKLFWR